MKFLQFIIFLQVTVLDRIKKIEIDLKREIGFIINSKINDPRVGFVTVTDVKLSQDFQCLDIFVSVMGEDKIINKTMDGLKNCSGFIKRNLKERFKLRNMPDLKFIYDSSIYKGIRVSELLEDIKKK
ncbi:MAG: 30S ribosome-binding factor RbfA [Actinobacteria bacterium]|nr:30S ribosome-binding factor RbfA [Actinomycetota bacterium]MBM3712965.1 30S ribosome-binding factor RbfA [Actinomycetota bacterium]